MQELCQICGHVMGRGEWQAYDLATKRSLGHLSCWGKPQGILGVDGDVWPCECVTGQVLLALFHRPCRSRRTCAVSRAVEAGRFKALLSHQLVNLRDAIFGETLDGREAEAKFLRDVDDGGVLP